MLSVTWSYQHQDQQGNRQNIKSECPVPSKQSGACTVLGERGAGNGRQAGCADVMEEAGTAKHPRKCCHVLYRSLLRVAHRDWKHGPKVWAASFLFARLKVCLVEEGDTCTEAREHSAPTFSVISSPATD